MPYNPRKHLEQRDIEEAEKVISQLDDSKNTGKPFTKQEIKITKDGKVVHVSTTDKLPLNKWVSIGSPNPTGNELDETDILWNIARIPRSEHIDETEQRKLFDTHLEALIEQQVLIGRIDSLEYIKSQNIVIPCEPDCDELRHAKHEGAWEQHLEFDQDLDRQITTLKAQLKEIE